MVSLKIADDEEFVHGRSPEKAGELVDAALAAGLESRVVKVTTNGYIVPKSILGGDAPSGQEPDEEEASEEVVEEDSVDSDFDPAEHSVAQVHEYLKSATEEERVRVVAAEREGKARISLLPDDNEGEG